MSGPARLGRRAIAALLLILALGALMRFGRIGAGLPAVFLADEELVAKNALSLPARRTLEPLYFDYPTLGIYLYSAIDAALYLGGRALGAYTSPTDFGAKFFVDPTPVYFAGRFAAAAMGVGAILVVFLLGRRFYSTRAGLFGALLLALGIETAREAGLALPNAPLGFLTVLAFWPLANVAERGRARDYAIAGAAIGLAVAAKYNAGLLVLTLVAAHLAGGRRPLARLALGAACAAATFLAITPYWILAFPKYLDGYLLQASHMRTGHVGFMGKTPFLWAVREIVAQERVAGVLAFLGGAVALARRRLGDRLILAFLVPTFLSVSLLANQQLDYLAALWPPAAILGGRALAAILDRGPFARSRVLAAAAVILALAPTALGAVGELRRATHPDTRVLAGRWIEANIPEGTGVAFDQYHYVARLLDAGRARRSQMGRQVDADFGEAVARELAGRPTYRLVPIIVPSGEVRVPEADLTPAARAALVDRVARDRFLQREFATRSRGLDELSTEGAAYLLLSSRWTDRFLVGKAPPRENPLYYYWLRERDYFRSLLADPRLAVVRSWEPGPGISGPRVTLYRVPDSGGLATPNLRSR